jgi:predicted nucleotidyltransferase
VPEPTFDELVAAMKKGAGILQDAGIPFVLAGGLAAWSRGGPKTEHDVDFMIKADDADRALQAFEEAGHRTERPPERWLYKAYVDSDVLIDLIFNPSGGAVTDESLERAEELEVAALRLRVASLEDVLVTKLLSLTEQEPAFEGVLELARALREQIDWDDVRERTADSPFAKAFFTLVEELGIVERTEA